MKAALIISERDNVATALEPLPPGRRLQFAALALVVREPIPPGHKIALVGIEAGQPIVKYGSPIGTASVPIEAGAHVHVHNVASARGRGDLGPVTPLRSSDVPRLAEPPDDATDIAVSFEPFSTARRSG